VPKNERLEQLGRQWAAEKTVYKRLLAIQALQEFRCEENRKLIEPFLADTRTEKAHPMSKWQVGRYTVREKAAELLTSWGGAPSSLPMSGPLLIYQPVNFLSVAAALILVGGLLLFLMRVLRRRLNLPWFRCIALSLPVLALAILWWRSNAQVDELMFSTGRSQHEIASYGGGIQYQVRHDWDIPVETVYGSFDRGVSEDVWSIDSQNPASRRSLLGFTFASGSSLGPEKSAHRFGLVRIGYWVPIGIAMIPIVFSLRSVAAQVRRRRLGLCLQCGYDLRESPGGPCPECGNEISQHHPAVSAALLQTRNEMPIGGHAVGV
jgi:hypothetical protein